MVELIVKLLVAAGVAAAGFLLGRPELDLAVKCAAALAAVAYFGFVLDRRGLRNAGVAGFLAAAESAGLAFALQGAGLLSDLGFLVLAPCAWAASRSGSMPIATTPLAVAALLGAHVALAPNPQPSRALLLSAVGVLAVGLLLDGPRRRVTESLAPQTVASEDTVVDPEFEQALIIRENYRQLKDAYSDLETRSRRDKAVAELADLREGGPVGYPKRVVGKIAEWTKVQKVALYTVAHYAGTVVVRASTDPSLEEDRPVEVDVRQAPSQIKAQLERTIARRLPDSQFRNVALVSGGKLVGLLSLIDEDPTVLERARRLVEEAASSLALALQQEARREVFERRLKESETLYHVAALADGAESRSGIADRVVREIAATLDVCHLGVTWLDGDEAIPLATEGTTVRLVDRMSFAMGPGLSGWLATGAPELLLFDVRSDARCPQAEALKARVGSYFVIPLSQEDRPIGFLSAASDRAGGLDVTHAETLRVVAAELGRTLQRVDPSRIDPEGILTPKQFQAKIGSTPGHLVVLELLRRDQVLESFGRPAVAHAIRTFATRVRSRLPLGGVVCRKSDTEVVAFLPGISEPQASSWANEMAATASMIGLRTPDGASPMPLAFRAKVAALRPQKDQISREKVA